MFTGIIETMGVITGVEANGGNKTFWIESNISNQLKADQSVSHSGVCLTVEQVADGRHRVTAIEETLNKTNLSSWQVGHLVNLERSLKLDSQLDGHLVQGHIDSVATCTRVKEQNGSWEFEFTYPRKFAELVIEKGSVCIDGISLTAFDVRKKSFKVAIIPYTYEHTNIKAVRKGEIVNIEFDMIGKYVLRRLSLKE
jgi:riboflavin synthase